MLTKTTKIGIGVGVALLGIGIASLIVNSPFLHNEVREYTIDVEKKATYEFDAPKDSHQHFKVTGEKFHIKLETPGDGIQKNEDYKKEITFDWNVQKEGTNKITIINNGPSQLKLYYDFNRYGDPALLTHSIMLLITGVVVIGFSAGFSAKKPKGF